MNQTRNRIIILICAIIIMVVFGFFYARSFANAVKLKNECNTTTDGEVYTNPYNGRSTDFRERVGARFTVDGVSYRASGVDIVTHHSGDIVPVHYKQGDPSVAYAGTDPQRMSDLFAILVFMSCSLAIFGVVKQLISQK